MQDEASLVCKGAKRRQPRAAPAHVFWDTPTTDKVTVVSFPCDSAVLAWDKGGEAAGGRAIRCDGHTQSVTTAVSCVSLALCLSLPPYLGFFLSCRLVKTRKPIRSPDPQSSRQLEMHVTRRVLWRWHEPGLGSVVRRPPEPGPFSSVCGYPLQAGPSKPSHASQYAQRLLPSARQPKTVSRHGGYPTLHSKRPET